MQFYDLKKLQSMSPYKEHWEEIAEHTAVSHRQYLLLQLLPADKSVTETKLKNIESEIERRINRLKRTGALDTNDKNSTDILINSLWKCVSDFRDEESVDFFDFLDKNDEDYDSLKTIFTYQLLRIISGPHFNYFMSNATLCKQIDFYSKLVSSTAQEKQVFADMYEHILENPSKYTRYMHDYNLRICKLLFPDDTVSFSACVRRIGNKPAKSTSPSVVNEVIKQDGTNAYGRPVWKVKRTYKKHVEEATLREYRFAFKFHRAFLKTGKPEYDESFSFYIPKNYKNHLAFLIKTKFFRDSILSKDHWFELLKEVGINPKEDYSYNAFQQQLSSVAVNLYKLYRDEAKDLFDDLVRRQLTLHKDEFINGKTKPSWDGGGTYKASPAQICHDALYQFAGLASLSMQSKLTKGAIKELTKMSEDDFIAYNSIVRQCPASDRKWLSNKIKKHVNPSELREEFNKRQEESILKEYCMEGERFAKALTHYVKIMQRYIPHFTAVQFLRTFGKNAAKKILLQKNEGLFTPKSYTLPSSEKPVLANEVSEKLGSRNNIKDERLLKSRQRLYGKLSKICSVEDILKGKIQNSDIPFIKEAIGLPKDKVLDASKYFSAKIEPKTSPEFLVAGDASVCCMGFGSEKAIQYAKEKGFGIFNVYYKDRIIANSLIWVNQKKNGDKTEDEMFVIDNIEVAPNYVKYTEQIKALYIALIEDMKKQYPVIVQGGTYNDLNLYDNQSEVFDMRSTPDLEPFEDIASKRKVTQYLPKDIDARKYIYLDALHGCYELYCREGHTPSYKQKLKPQEQDDPKEESPHTPIPLMF